MRFHKYKLDVPENAPLNKTAGDKYWNKLLKEPKERILSLWTTQNESVKKKKKFIDHVCIVGIETSKYCNRKCSYCPDSIAKYERSKQTLMSEKIWKRILDDLIELDYKSTISLNLYNEALADPTIFHKITEVKECLPNSFVKFNSNGDFLTIQMLEKLKQSGLDALFISLHPPMNKPYEDNDRIKAHEKFYKKIGYDGNYHNIVHGKSIRTDLNFEGMRVLIMSDNWYDTGTNRGGLVENAVKIYKNREDPCWRPYREFIISCDGSVVPCCQIFPDEITNEKYFWGNVSNMKIWDIYSKEIADEWRRELFKYHPKKAPCDDCSDPCQDDPANKDIRNSIIG